MKDIQWLDRGVMLYEESVVSAENELSVRFPDDYRNFVKMHAGGSNPSPSSFEFFYPEIGKWVGCFGNLLSLRWDQQENVFECIRDLQGQIPDNVIPIGGSPNGDLICLDYRSGYPPKVVYWAHELPAGQSIIPLADSFTHFLDSLYPFDEAALDALLNEDLGGSGQEP